MRIFLRIEVAWPLTNQVRLSDPSPQGARGNQTVVALTQMMRQGLNRPDVGPVTELERRSPQLSQDTLGGDAIGRERATAARTSSSAATWCRAR